MFYLLLAVILYNGPGSVWPQPVRSLSDEDITNQDMVLTSPEDAILWREKLYVADGRQHMVFVKDEVGQTRTLGRAGQGPGEFATPPQFLSVHQDSLVVEEMNRFKASFFDRDLQFKGSEKRRSDKWHLQDWLIRQLQLEEALGSRKMYQAIGEDCFFVDMAEPSDLGFHLSRAMIFPIEDEQLVTVTKSGVIAVYKDKCELSASLTLPLEGMAREPEVNKLGTALGKAKGYKGKAYTGGHPVIDAAAKDAQNIWLLIQDETKPQSESIQWLYFVDAEAGEILGRRTVPYAYTGLVYSEDHLILIANKNALVQVYKPSQLFSD